MLRWGERFRWVVIGVLLSIAGPVLAMFIYAKSGGEYMGSDIRPSHIEAQIANMTLDSSVDAWSKHRPGPYPATDVNLITGAREYEEHCALCHGGLFQQKSPLRHSVYPGAPQFVANQLGGGKSGGHGSEMPGWHLHYIIRHGIRWTAMPAWGGNLRDDEIWKIVLFLENMKQLPLPVMQAWREAAGKNGNRD